MPMLKRENVKPLLSIFNRKSAQRQLQETTSRRDVDPDADPLSSSDSEIEELESLPDNSAREKTSLRRKATPEKRSLRGSSSANDFAVQKQDLSSLSSGDLQKGQKRKRNPVSGIEDGLELFDEKETAFNGMLSSDVKRKNRKQYGRRFHSSTVSNMHVSPKNDGAADMSKSTRAGFKGPAGIVESCEWGNKEGFHAPIPLQDQYDIQNTKSAFKNPSRPPSSTRSSHSSPFQTCRSVALSTESSSVLSSPPASEILESTQEHYEQQLKTLESLDSPPGSPKAFTAKLPVAHCPMCKAKVESDYLWSFSKGKKLSLRAAMDFCVAHKQRSVETDWTQSKYPLINWSNLDKRLRKFNGDLHAILERRAPSTYWKELEEKVALGKSRNALRNPEAEGVQSLKGLAGYYGGKGARKLMEHIMSKFAAKIRVLAAKDRLFTEVGVSGFVQAVLLPELVVMLVIEDQGGCDAARARQIVSESADAGDLMNEEEEERVEEKVIHDNVNLAQLSEGATVTRLSSTTQKQNWPML